MDVKREATGAKSKKALQSERTRAALLREATRLFARQGYEATFIDEVARRARVTKGALYHQFRDKRDLFEAVVEERVAHLIRTVKRESGARMERLGVSRRAVPRYLAGLDILMDGMCEPTNRRILLLEGAVVLGRERWDELWGEQMLGLVRSVFRDGFERGDLEPGLVESLSRLVYGALLEMALAIGHSDDADATRRELAAAAEWMLASLLGPRPDDR